MFRQTASDARRPAPRLVAGARLRGLGGTYEQLFRPGQGRQRD